MLSAGTASASEEKTTLQGLRTRAVPPGVTALHSPGLGRFHDTILAIATTVIVINIPTSSGKYTETPAGREE